MALAIDPLIRLQGVSKIFHTEEVETHALSPHRPRDPRGRVRRDLRGRRAAARPRCFHPRPARFAERGQLRPGRRAGLHAVRRAARAGPGPRHRLRLPGLQPHRRPDRVPERRAAAHAIAGLARRGAARRGARGARAGGAAAPAAPLPGAALRRPAAARGRGARGGGKAAGDPGRRAHRQPGLGQRRRRSWRCSASCTPAAPRSSS